jgi:hypothetical protein
MRIGVAQVGKIKTRIVYNPTVYGTSIRHLFCNEHTPLPAALVCRRIGRLLCREGSAGQGASILIRVMAEALPTD